MGLQQYIHMTMDETGNQIVFTRNNKETPANEEEIKQFEKTALSGFGRGKEVFIIEQFPKSFFYFASKIRLEKVAAPVSTLSEQSNSRLFKVLSTHSMFE